MYLKHSEWDTQRCVMASVCLQKTDRHEGLRMEPRGAFPQRGKKRSLKELCADLGAL